MLEVYWFLDVSPAACLFKDQNTSTWTLLDTTQNSWTPLILSILLTYPLLSPFHFFFRELSVPITFWNHFHTNVDTFKNTMFPSTWAYMHAEVVFLTPKRFFLKSLEVWINTKIPVRFLFERAWFIDWLTDWLIGMIGCLLTLHEHSWYSCRNNIRKLTHVQLSLITLDNVLSLMYFCVSVDRRLLV